MNTQSCKQMQKGTTVFEKGAFKKRKLDKKTNFLNKKRTHRQEICNCVWKSQRQRKQNNTHKEKQQEKQKRTRTFKKRKRTKDPSQQKRWKMTENQKQSKKQNLQKVQEEVETAKTQGDNEKTTKKKEKHKKKKKIKNKENNDKNWKATEKTRSMTTVCTWDLTRPTTSRHAAMVNRAFNLKSWYFLTRKDYQNMRSGHFLLQKQCFGEFSTKLKKTERDFKNDRKTMIEWLFFIKLPKFRK